MAKWFHKVDLDWLKARQKCLTATDVMDLIPFTKTGRKRTITDEHYMKVLARKLANLTEDDCVSTGAAARGHILEPYAIDRYNEEDFGGNEFLWHWDDLIVTRSVHQPFALSFSPDAMSLDPNSPLLLKDSVYQGIGFDVDAIGEVKCYSPERHMLCGYTEKEDLEERWQVATAMAVLDSIKTAYLLFYNPSMQNQLYIVDYDRSDLYDEIDTILQVEKDWLSWVGNFGKHNYHYLVKGKASEEQSIIDAIIKAEELNPEGERSVVR